MEQFKSRSFYAVGWQQGDFIISLGLLWTSHQTLFFFLHIRCICLCLRCPFKDPMRKQSDKMHYKRYYKHKLVICSNNPSRPQTCQLLETKMVQRIEENMNGNKILHFVSIWRENFLQICNSLLKCNCFPHIIISDEHLSLCIALWKIKRFSKDV